MKLFFSYFLQFDASRNNNIFHHILIASSCSKVNQNHIVAWYWQTSNRHPLNWCNNVLWWNLWFTHQMVVWKQFFLGFNLSMACWIVGEYSLIYIYVWISKALTVDASFKNHPNINLWKRTCSSVSWDLEAVQAVSVYEAQEVLGTKQSFFCHHPWDSSDLSHQLHQQLHFSRHLLASFLFLTMCRQ